jgi:hypothetical protein
MTFLWSAIDGSSKLRSRQDDIERFEALHDGVSFRQAIGTMFPDQLFIRLGRWSAFHWFSGRSPKPGPLFQVRSSQQQYYA